MRFVNECCGLLWLLMLLCAVGWCRVMIDVVYCVLLLFLVVVGVVVVCVVVI